MNQLQVHGKFHKKCYVLNVVGEDARSFLHGQFTSNIKDLNVSKAHLSCRLSLHGKLLCFFYVCCISENEFQLISFEQDFEDLQNDLDKFIIMEDVELSRDIENFVFYLGLDALKIHKSAKGCLTSYAGIPCFVSKENKECYSDISKDALDLLELSTAHPRWKRDIKEATLANNTILNELAIDYDKGCFLGQETVAKINTRRGAAYYPMLLETQENLSDGDILLVDGKKVATCVYGIPEKHLYHLLVAREYRIDNSKITASVNDKEVSGNLNEFKKWPNYKDYLDDLYHEAVKIFTDNEDTDTAVQILSDIITVDPLFEDAYESLGVIYGRIGEFDKAIELMKKLSELNPKLVMPHTNLSFFYMKQGKIEEAEAEKATATVKSFQSFGDEAKQKEEEQKRIEEKRQEDQRREQMFKEVLEIDPDDTMANYGLGEICFSNDDFTKALEHLDIVLKEDEKYSVAYLLKGKSLEAIGDYENAKVVYEKGIKIAAKNGDMMPANQMQARLVKL